MARKVDFLLSCDHGMSSTKAFWSTPEGVVQLMLLPSEMKRISSDELLDRGLKRNGPPELDAWIETDYGDLVAIGQKAKYLRGQPPLTQSKYQPSIYKIMACVGAVAQRLDLSSPLKVGLGTLLPYTEYQDRDNFLRLLEENLRKFKFRGKRYEVELETVYIQPEGAGIASSFQLVNPELLEEQNVLVLMLGHRDVSVLPFEQGMPVQLDQHGEQLGFIRFQNEVKDRAALNTSVSNLALLPEYLFLSQNEPEYTERIARMVVDPQNSGEVNRKIQQINAAADVAHRLYMSDLIGFIRTTCETFLQTADQILIGGGPALYFKKDLEAFFGSYPNLRHHPISWGLECADSIRRVIGDVPEHLMYRITDIYAIHEGLTDEMGIPLLPAQPGQTQLAATPTIETIEADADHGGDVEVAVEAKPATARRSNNGRVKSAQLPNVGKRSK